MSRSNLLPQLLLTPGQAFQDPEIAIPFNPFKASVQAGPGFFLKPLAPLKDYPKQVKRCKKKRKGNNM